LDRIVDPNRHFDNGTPIRSITRTGTYLREVHTVDFNIFRRYLPTYDIHPSLLINFFSSHDTVIKTMIFYFGIPILKAFCHGISVFLLLTI
jgi:hypothetical protein